MALPPVPKAAALNTDVVWKLNGAADPYCNQPKIMERTKDIAELIELIGIWILTLWAVSLTVALIGFLLSAWRSKR